MGRESPDLQHILTGQCAHANRVHGLPLPFLNAGKPNARYDFTAGNSDEDSVSENVVGGASMWNPCAASALKTFTVPTPSMDLRSAPKCHVPIVPPKVALKAEVVPVGVALPYAAIVTPATFVQ
jgi:hypothetical protein